jgi:hypothetical protein
VAELVKVIRTGVKSAAQNPVKALPDHGVITAADAHLFTAQWPG